MRLYNVKIYNTAPGKLKEILDENVFYDRNDNDAIQNVQKYVDRFLKTQSDDMWEYTMVDVELSKYCVGMIRKNGTLNTKPGKIIHIMCAQPSQIEKRITKENITDLNDNEVFVFGTNTTGFHSKFAMKFGAITGQVGYNGKTFAIATTQFSTPRPLDSIKMQVEDFVKFAKSNLNMKFFVTKLGCGHAKYTPRDIAPLFKEAKDLKNVYLPEEFLDFLSKWNCSSEDYC